jgi:hypothetical protein
LIPVTTGTSETVTLTSAFTQVIWSSSTAGAKTTNIPAAGAGNAGFRLGVATTLGNGDSHTVTPAGGTIAGAASVSFTDAAPSGSNIELMSDGTSNWILL